MLLTVFWSSSSSSSNTAALLITVVSHYRAGAPTHKEVVIHSKSTSIVSFINIHFFNWSFFVKQNRVTSRRGSCRLYRTQNGNGQFVLPCSTTTRSFLYVHSESVNFWPRVSGSEDRRSLVTWPPGSLCIQLSSTFMIIPYSPLMILYYFQFFSQQKQK